MGCGFLTRVIASERSLSCGGVVAGQEHLLSGLGLTATQVVGRVIRLSRLYLGSYRHGLVHGGGQVAVFGGLVVVGRIIRLELLLPGRRELEVVVTLATLGHGGVFVLVVVHIGLGLVHGLVPTIICLLEHLGSQLVLTTLERICVRGGANIERALAATLRHPASVGAKLRRPSLTIEIGMGTSSKHIRR